MLKRAVDILISSVALVLLAPVLVGIAACIVIFDGRPVFYRGVRAGRFGKTFRIFKFRTMVVGAERLGGSATSDTDVRITRFGHALRRHKLDELPQLLNVFFGDMSLVGPRPEVPEYVELLSLSELAILSVRPGITDWATLWDSDEGALLAQSAQPEQMYLHFIRPNKVKLQLEYVRRQSMWVDLSIICKTAYVVIFKPVPPSFSALEQYNLGLMQTSTLSDGRVVSEEESNSVPERKAIRNVRVH